MPLVQVRDMTVQRRENDLVLGTFGRGFFVLDDYSALRDISSAALAEDARIFPLRDAYLYNLLDQAPAIRGSRSASAWSAPNPPFGAVFTYHVRQALPTDQKLVLTITDENGRMIRRLDLDGSPGLRRTAWNLRAEVPAATDQGQGAAGRGGRGGGGGVALPAGAVGQQGPLVEPGRYRATLGRLSGDIVTPIGQPQTFGVVQVRQ